MGSNKREPEPDLPCKLAKRCRTEPPPALTESEGQRTLPSFLSEDQPGQTEPHPTAESVPAKIRRRRSPNFFCNEYNCREEFISELALKDHIIRAHKGERTRYKCPYCPNVYYTGSYTLVT